MSWTCEQVEASLSEYLDGLLGEGARREFDAHANHCDRCGPLVARVSGVVSGLHRLELLEEPPELASIILDKTLGPRKQKLSWRSAFEWLRLLSQPRFAYSAVSIAITLAVLLPSLGINWRHVRLADFRPANLYRAADRQVHLVYARGSKFVADLRVVYEIQSRLRPETEPGAGLENKKLPQNSPDNPPGMTNGPQRNQPRELNRADQLHPELSVLASALPSAWERSLP